VQQRFQAVQATLVQGSEQRALAGRVDGPRVQWLGQGDSTGWSATLGADGALRLLAAPPASALQAGMVLQASSGAGCPGAPRQP
jgi:hypothetical protein